MTQLSECRLQDPDLLKDLSGYDGASSINRTEIETERKRNSQYVIHGLKELIESSNGSTKDQL